MFNSDQEGDAICHTLFQPKQQSELKKVSEKDKMFFNIFLLQVNS